MKCLTPWSPPSSWFMSVAERFPQLARTLEYLESGWIVAGRLSIANGLIIDESEAYPEEEISAFALDAFGWDLSTGV